MRSHGVPGGRSTVSSRSTGEPVVSPGSRWSRGEGTAVGGRRRAPGSARGPGAAGGQPGQPLVEVVGHGDRRHAAILPGRPPATPPVRGRRDTAGAGRTGVGAGPVSSGAAGGPLR